MSPFPYTLRQLFWMDEGKEEAAWWHTSAIITELRNRAEGSDFVLLRVNGNKNIRPPKPTDIRDVHPYERQRREEKQREQKRSVLDLFSGWI